MPSTTDPNPSSALAEHAGPPRVLTPFLAVLAVLALGAAGYLGWSYYHPRPTVVAAAERDAALRDAEQIALNISTLHQDSVEADLTRWQDSATGPLLADFRRRHGEMVKIFQQSKTTDVAHLKDAALTEFDPVAGTARAIVAVDLVITPDGGKPSTKRQLDQIQLQRTPEGWKASAAGPVVGRS